MRYFPQTLLWLALLLLPFSGTVASTVVYTPADSVIFEDYKREHLEYRDLPINELLVLTAKYFIGKPYAAHTLEGSEKEKLTVNLREFDCTTFVESCLALAQTIKSKDDTFSGFCSHLKNIRYRNGTIEDYSSRLHYVSDWMHEHEKDKVMRNVSKEMGGYLDTKKITFMSSNLNLYPHLLNNKELQKKVKIIEEKLNKRGGYYVLSKEKIHTAVSTMKNGDLVIFSTSISNLDFTHMGIISKVGGDTRFIHASSTAKKVITENKSLQEYCNNSKRCNGIVILRLNL